MIQRRLEEMFFFETHKKYGNDAGFDANYMLIRIIFVVCVLNDEANLHNLITAVNLKPLLKMSIL